MLWPRSRPAQTAAFARGSSTGNSKKVPPARDETSAHGVTGRRGTPSRRRSADRNQALTPSGLAARWRRMQAWPPSPDGRPFGLEAERRTVLGAAIPLPGENHPATRIRLPSLAVARGARAARPATARVVNAPPFRQLRASGHARPCIAPAAAFNPRTAPGRPTRSAAPDGCVGRPARPPQASHHSSPSCRGRR